MVSHNSTPSLRPPRPLRRRALSATDLRNVSQDFSDASIKVIARLRPIEGESVCEIKVLGDGKKAVIVDRNQFKFSDVIGSAATQAEVFDTVGAPMLKSFLEGYNVALVAYGHTGSGKTFSLCGTRNKAGVVPRFCDALWKESNGTGQVTVSFFEIYQEKVYDLLSTSRQALRIRGTEQPYVEGVTIVKIDAEDDFASILSAGWANRATAATVANNISSRSHAVVLIRYTRSKKVGGKEASVSSCCYFVDLAGSEKTPFDGVQRDESLAINTSLSALRRVVMNRAANPMSFVGCRESALTRLLQDAFFGNSRTFVLATIHPDRRFHSETMATLRFATDACKVKLKPVVNLDEISVLEQEIVKLKGVLNGLQANPQSVHFIDAQPPGLFELFADSALNTYSPVIGETLFGESNQATFTVSVTDGCLFISSSSGVFVNGKIESHLKLKQGDSIVLDGKRFFTAYCENAPCDEMLNFYRAKSEYTEATFPEIEKRLRDEAREALQEEISNENAMLKRAIEELNDRLRQQTKSAEEQRLMAEELETFVVLQKNLQQEHEKQKSKLNKGYGFNSAISEADVAVSIANDVLESYGKKAIFSFKLEFSDDKGSVHVRLINRKQRITADLTLSEFYGLKERLCEAYKTSLVDGDNLGIVERLLYSENWHWNQISSHRSSLFNTAVLNGLRKQSLAMRRSSKILVSIDEKIDEKNEIYEFFKLNLCSQLTARIQEITAETSRITSLARSIYDIHRFYERLTAIENGILHDDSSILVAKFDTLRAIECFIAHVTTLPGIEGSDRVQQYVTEMRTTGVSIAKSFDSWIYSNQQNSAGTVFLDVIKCSIDDLYVSLGRLIFWCETERPDVTLNSESEKLVDNAMRKELAELLEEIQTRVTRLRKHSALLFELIALLGEAFVVIATDFLKRPWSWTTMKTVLWPLRKLGKQIMQVKGPISTSFIDSVKQVKENAAGLLCSEVMDSANPLLEKFVSLCV